MILAMFTRSPWLPSCPALLVPGTYKTPHRETMFAMWNNKCTSYPKPQDSHSHWYKLFHPTFQLNVDRKTDRKGTSEGARLLLRILVQKEDWFTKLHTVLCDESVKLWHIADIMMHEKNRIQQESASQSSSRRRTRADNSGPVSSLSALYIRYNRDLENEIRKLFVVKICDPVLVLRVFQMCSNKVLTQIDCQNVQAKMNNNGPYQGADLLFSRLVLYDSWLDVLLQTLKHDDIRLQELAEEIESCTRTIKEDYERKRSQILHLYNMNNNGQLTDNRMATDDPCSVPRMDGSRNNLLQNNFRDEIESDCAEMRPAAKRQARSSEKKENTFSDGSRHGQNLASQEGSSKKRVGTTGKTQLMSAAESGDMNLILNLLNGGANIDECDSKGRTALMYAVLKCQFECVQLLVSNGCDVNKRDINGYTVVMIAADEGFTDCLRCLIDADSNVDNANNAGSTALMVAAKKGFVGCMQLLIENGCDIEKCHKDGCTALMFASFYGHPECVDLLIRSRCDVNKANYNRMTALMYAVTSCQTECTKLLINGDADVDLADKDGNTAVMYAVLCKETECLKLLVEHIA